MSGKRKEDYKAVFKAVRAEIDDLRLREAVMNFKAAMWAGLRAVLPDTRIKGCLFHWVQAVWRHIQAIGLQEAYNKDRGTHSYLRKLMALPFLPQEHMLQIFLRLSSQAVGDKPTRMCTYVHDTWISSSTWPPVAWSVFQQQVRTNNDVKGGIIR